MTERVIVATFENSDAAYAAANALELMRDIGSIDFTVKAGVMIEKDDLGNVKILETKHHRLRGTAVGHAVIASINSGFVDSVTSEMRPGMAALIVEADEKSTDPLDQVVAQHGGRVYRQTAS